jgi:hypothetical protein
MKPNVAVIVRGGIVQEVVADLPVNVTVIGRCGGAAMNQMEMAYDFAQQMVQQTAGVSARKKRANLFDTADLSALELDRDEPLSSDVIQSYQAIAHKVIEQAIEDLSSNDEDAKRAAIRFCLDKDRRHREIRLLWLGWIGMSEEVLARAATLRLNWSAGASPSTTRQSRFLPAAEGRPIPRSGPIQPEGLSYRA